MASEETRQTKQFSGDLNALAGNVMAAVSMADVVRTTMGPRGLDKLLVDQMGNRVITNDGYTVLVSLKTSHPVSRLLVEIAERQEMNVGDGTTSTVIMAAEMLKEGYRMTSECGIHPSRILSELDEGVEIVAEYFEQIQTPIESLKDPRVKDVLKTATASKLDGKQLSNHIMLAADHLGPQNRTDLRHGILLLRRLGDDVFVDGVAIEAMPQESSIISQIIKPKICFIKDSLEFPLPGYQMEEDEQHDVQRKKIINSLENKGINVVLTNAPKIDAILKMELLAKNILLIRVSTEELILFSRSLEVPAIYGAQLASGYVPPFFEAESIELDEDKNLTILRAPKSGVAATLIIGGATTETSKERMRTCIDGICGLHYALKGGIVPGGGIAELNAARYLEKKMLEGKSQNIGCGILIKGLESISRQILDNAGYNGYEMMIRLRSQPDGVGINVVDGDYINMIENGIIDSRITKMHAIQIAVHIVKTILKIDRNLLKDEPRE
ncbi:TCP-1/cpn60 chaperonin family protein [Candidatus Methanomassiliicoccus intestinalis]|uniref:TCP-1/cpn60 chaperonin family protein n=2 Tax=Candidatus Methanomassiliicoccus intestinalis TaxID=1406512 RepID=UPI0037DD2976